MRVSDKSFFNAKIQGPKLQLNLQFSFWAEKENNVLRQAADVLATSQERPLKVPRGKPLGRQTETSLGHLIGTSLGRQIKVSLGRQIRTSDGDVSGMVK